MPAGPTIAGLWDAQHQRYVALSRPFEVEPRRSVAAPLERPNEVAQLLVQLLWGEAPLAEKANGPEMMLSVEGSERPPDLRIVTAASVYAVWYDLPPGEAILRAGSDRYTTPEQKVTLTQGRIERLTGQLEPRKPVLR